MVETISPVVHGGRNRAYFTAVAAHAVAATASAATLGLTLGALGTLVGAPFGGDVAPLVIGAIALAYAARELVRLPIPLPDLDRQVPDWWRTFYRPRTAATLYGFGLGVGFLTYLSFGTLVPVAAGAFVYGDPLLGAALLAPFGAARGLSLLVAAPHARTPEQVSEALRSRSGTLGRLANSVALVATVTMAAYQGL